MYDFTEIVFTQNKSNVRLSKYSILFIILIVKAHENIWLNNLTAKYKPPFLGIIYLIDILYIIYKSWYVMMKRVSTKIHNDITKCYLWQNNFPLFLFDEEIKKFSRLFDISITNQLNTSTFRSVSYFTELSHSTTISTLYIFEPYMQQYIDWWGSSWFYFVSMFCCYLLRSSY